VTGIIFYDSWGYVHEVPSLREKTHSPRFLFVIITAAVVITVFSRALRIIRTLMTGEAIRSAKDKKY